MNRYYKKCFLPFTIPATVFYLMVVFIPFILGLIYSFTAWKGTYFANSEGKGGPIYDSFVGFKNYIQTFKNPQFLNSFIYTVVYTAVAVVVINFIAIILALMLDKLLYSSGIFRTIYFIPNLLGGIALGYVWQIIFQNVYIIVFGPEGILPIGCLTYMLQNRWSALFALVIMMTWQMAGYMIIIYTAGLNNIPRHLYEAASIDGANSFQRFKTVTIPMLMPTFTVVFFLTIANSFKLLDQNVALTNGDFDTRLLAMQILKTTQDSYPSDYGQAQAQAVIFFVIVAVVTLFQVALTKKREVEF